MTKMMTKMTGYAIDAMVIIVALSIPALVFAAFWYDNINYLWLAVVPFIFFMAG